MTVIPGDIAVQIRRQVQESDHTPAALDRIAIEHGLMPNELMKLVQPNGRANGGPRPTPPSAPLTARPDDVLVLLDTAKQAGSKRIRALAHRVHGDVDKLRDLLAAEQEKTAARECEERGKSEARAEVERLEAQLAAAKAKLRPAAALRKTAPATRHTATANATGVTAKEIRSWAASAGVECTPVGRLPRSVVDAYRAAHPA